MIVHSEAGVRPSLAYTNAVPVEQAALRCERSNTHLIIHLKKSYVEQEALDWRTTRVSSSEKGVHAMDTLTVPSRVTGTHAAEAVTAAVTGVVLSTVKPDVAISAAFPTLSSAQTVTTVRTSNTSDVECYDRLL